MSRLLIVLGPDHYEELKNDLLARNSFMREHLILPDARLAGGVTKVPLNSSPARYYLDHLNEPSHEVPPWLESNENQPQKGGAVTYKQFHHYTVALNVCAYLLIALNAFLAGYNMYTHRFGWMWVNLVSFFVVGMAEIYLPKKIQ